MRRQFNLSERDRRFLDSLGVPWEAIREANNLWIIIHDYPIPSGYNCAFAAVAIKIESGYPDAQLDMAYFNPHLARRDGKAIPQTDTAVGLDGKTFQRWSRLEPDRTLGSQGRIRSKRSVTWFGIGSAANSKGGPK